MEQPGSVKFAKDREDPARAVDVFGDELERAEALGLPFVVIHPGSHRGDGVEGGIRRVARAIDVLHERSRG